MKINEAIPSNYMRLNFLHPGEVFEYESVYFIKTNETLINFRKCVNLSNGYVVEMKEDLTVKKVNMEGTITNGL